MKSSESMFVAFALLKYAVDTPVQPSLPMVCPTLPKWTFRTYCSLLRVRTLFHRVLVTNMQQRAELVRSPASVVG